MKKILTVSLFAVMAVSAARAQIASVEYVKGENVLGLTNGQTVQSELNNAVVPAVKALQNKVDQISEGTGLTLGADAVDTDNIVDDAVTLEKVGQDVIDSIADAKKAGTDASNALTDHIQTAESTFETKQEATAKLNAAKAYTDAAATATDGTLSGGFVKQYVDGQIGELGDVANVVEYVDAVADTVSEANEIITQLNTGLTDIVKDGGTIDTKVNTKVGTLNGLEGSVAADGNYVVQTTEANGIVTVSRQAFDKSVSASGTDNTAPTTKAVYDAIEAAKGGIDSTHAAETNKFVTGMTQVDGVITEVTKSSIDAAVVALGQVPDACGANGTHKCALSVSNGTFTWEVIEN